MPLSAAQVALLKRLSTRQGVSQQDANRDGLRRKTYRALTAKGLITWDPILSLITITPEGRSALKAAQE